MTDIKQDDLTQNVADSLQHISYYRPLDYITDLDRAHVEAIKKHHAAYLIYVYL